MEIRAIEPFLDYFESIRGRTRRVIGCIPPERFEWTYAHGKFTFGALHAEAMAIFRTLTPEALSGKCLTPAGGSITVWKWLRAMVEHEVHHRGQIYLMLGLLGVRTPPLYGLTEEEVRARSA